MKFSKIFDLMGGDGVALYRYMRSQSRELEIYKGIKQYDPKLHDVANKTKRPDKTTFVPTGDYDKDTKKPIYQKETAPVARAPLAFQRYIINQKASFARANGVKLRPSKDNTRVFTRVQNNWIDNKTDFYLKEIAVRQMSETQVAAIFFGERGRESLDDFRFRFKIVSPEKGDKLEAFFDEDTDDMIAFGREYDVGDKSRYDLYVMNPTTNRCEIRRFENGEPLSEVFTDTLEDGTLRMGRREVIIQTPFTKLPVVYWEQDRPECDDTAELIAEMEAGFNDFLTQMGYSADPILFGKGRAMDMPPKGSAGKFVEGSEDSDLKFVTPDNATESRELQFDLLQKFIFTLNRAVLLDLDTMRELGDVSGAALERYLLDVYMEATDRQQGTWGIGVQRMANFLLSQWKELEGTDRDLRIEVLFTRFSVKDEMEKVEVAMKANGGKPVVTHEQSVAIADLADDVPQTTRTIKEESAEAERTPEPVN